MLTQHLRAARQTSQAGWGNFNGTADADASRGGGGGGHHVWTSNFYLKAFMLHFLACAYETDFSVPDPFPLYSQTLERESFLSLAFVLQQESCEGC